MTKFEDECPTCGMSRRQTIEGVIATLIWFTMDKNPGVDKAAVTEQVMHWLEKELMQAGQMFDAPDTGLN